MAWPDQPRVQRDLDPSAGPHGHPAAPRVVYEDPPHHLGRQSEDMRAILPRDVLLVDESKVGFVDEGGWLQRMVAPLPSLVIAGWTTQGLPSSPPQKKGPAEDPKISESSQTAWARVRINDPLVATYVRHALAEAAMLLAAPRCQTILTEFHDQRDRALVDRLRELEVDIASYLQLVVLIDGSENQRCGDTPAYTVAGSRVVRVCGGSVTRIWRARVLRVLAVALIHEVLHTLELGENPPSSADITRKVRALCGPSVS